MENSFIRVITEISNLSKTQKNQFDANLRGKWNNYLNELSGFDLNKINGADFDLLRTLIKALTTIPAEEDVLIVKCSFILTSIGKKQKIKLSEQDLKTALEWLINAIRINLCVGLCDILRAIEVLLIGVENDIPEISDYLVSTNRGVLMVLLTNPTKLQDKSLNYENCLPSEILLATVSCLKTLLNSPIKINESELNESMRHIHNLIFTNAAGKFSETNYIILMTCALNICRQICIRNRQICSRFIGENIGAAKAFMMFGLSDMEYSTHPQKVNVSQQTIEPVTFNANKGGKVVRGRKPTSTFKGRKHGNKNIKKTTAEESNFHCSDHEFNAYVTSDSDSTDLSRHKQSVEIKLRINALSLIGVIGRLVDTKSLFGYWHTLFPSDVATPTTVSLLNAAIRDPNARCRMVALQAATIILHGSKPFLSQAEQNDKPHSSYIPFSITLGDMILSMYSSINQALSTEGSLPVLIQVLKCLASLVEATPFNRLNDGLITRIMGLLRRLVYHKDPSIQVNALIVISLIIKHNDITKEISDCIGAPQINGKKPKVQQNVGVDNYAGVEDEEIEDERVPEDDSPVACNESDDVNENSKMSWLLSLVLNNLDVSVADTTRSPPTQTATMVRIESLQMISTVATHFQLIKNCLLQIAEAINNSCESGCFEIRLHAVKCLDVVGYCMNMYFANGTLKKKDDIELCSTFWTLVMPKVVEQIQNCDQVPTLKSICCDSLSNIGCQVFERLEYRKQLSLIALLSGCTFDESLVVQAAAIRALAVYIIFPSLRENVHFVENVTDAVIRALQQDNIDIRIKVSWALANISDALVANTADTNKEIMSDNLLKRLFDVSLICKDNDKVRCNAVRAMGNLLRLITEEHLRIESWRSLASHAIQELNQNIGRRGNAKLSWNACHAIGNMMKNSAIYSSGMKLCWQDDVVKTLCNVVVHNINFKVRINAAASLAIPTNEQFLQTHFSYIWSSLLEALDKSDEITDFNEYQHRDNLTEQLCVTISHYIQNAKADQLVVMEKDVLRFDSTKTNWTRVINRVIPEKATSLITAAMRLQNFLSDVSKPDQRKALSTLTTTFETILN
ncbi:HEAT repeat-containing protein 6 [Pseudolycoriella hygida]|uniref:HEAT repeat-containing protein 6 n=1 Tax=Pseudolycoriella hygida TaxID=35572 RepID=A0A9Q0MM16_9DIPT|nr:HEAT repeat-containing protein 6 [Pseudolycoriella hygida]